MYRVRQRIGRFLSVKKIKSIGYHDTVTIYKEVHILAFVEISDSVVLKHNTEYKKNTTHHSTRNITSSRCPPLRCSQSASRSWTLLSSKVKVWSAVAAFAIIDPYFFEDERGNACTVTSEHYAHMLQDFFIPRLQGEQNHLLSTRWGYKSHCKNCNEHFAPTFSWTSYFQIWRHRMASKITRLIGVYVQRLVLWNRNKCNSLSNTDFWCEFSLIL